MPKLMRIIFLHLYTLKNKKQSQSLVFYVGRYVDINNLTDSRKIRKNTIRITLMVRIMFLYFTFQKSDKSRTAYDTT